MSLTNGKIDFKYEKNNYVFHTDDISIEFSPNQLENIIGKYDKILEFKNGIYIKTFDITNIKHGNHVYIISPRAAGATVLSYNIVKNLVTKNVSGTIIDPFSLPNVNNYPDLSGVTKYKKFSKSYVDCLVMTFLAHNTKKFMLIDNENILKNNDNFVIKNCMDKYDISIIMTSQSGLHLDYNFDYIFLNTKSNNVLQRIYYKYFSSKFPTYNNFKQVYNKIISKPYRFMVYDKINDEIYMYKGKLFNLGISH